MAVRDAVRAVHRHGGGEQYRIGDPAGSLGNGLGAHLTMGQPELPQVSGE